MKTIDRTSFIVVMVEVVCVCVCVCAWAVSGVHSYALIGLNTLGWLYPMGNDGFDSYKGI